MSVVDAVSIDTVLAAEADCSDRVRAEAVLSKALAAARGPKRSREQGAEKHWQLDMQIVTSAPGIKSADAKILDDGGRVVAERTVSDRTPNGTCIALARAVGAWAQIVLDDELVRAHHDAENAKGPDPEPAEARPIVRTTSRPHPRPIKNDAEADDITPKPEKDQTVRTFEIGTTLFLRNGVAATGGVFGASPFVTIGFSKIWVLRPAFLVGTSTSKVPPDQSKSDNVSAVGGRLDFCRRLPGNYLDHRGIEVDACAGGDVMHISSDLSTAWRASLGPSGILRGELGNFGLEFRGMVGANLLRSGFVGGDAPYFVAGAELGGSVRFR